MHINVNISMSKSAIHIRLNIAHFQLQKWKMSNHFSNTVHHKCLCSDNNAWLGFCWSTILLFMPPKVLQTGKYVPSSAQVVLNMSKNKTLSLRF